MREADREEQHVSIDSRLIEGPIDLAALEAAISENGPIRVWHRDTGLEKYFSISPCLCGCNGNVVWAAYRHGVSFVRSIIDEEDLLHYSSLSDFLNAFFHHPDSFFISSGDEQMLEIQIFEKLGVDPFVVYAADDSDEAIRKEIDQSKVEDVSFWEVHTLVAFLNCIHRKRFLMRKMKTCSDEALFDALGVTAQSRDELIEYMRGIFDLGFLSGKLFSEYRSKTSFEELVEKGERSAHAQHSRTIASGAASAKKKRENIECLLVEIERLESHFPAISEQAIISQAWENACKKRPMPKSKAAKDDYETTLRSEEPFKSRYFNVFRKNA